MTLVPLYETLRERYRYANAIRNSQFAIRNSQFAIKFCNGDLDPAPKRAALQRLGVKPPKFVKGAELRQLLNQSRQLR